jgi:HEAT repeat protein
MRGRTLGVLAALAAALGGCGGEPSPQPAGQAKVFPVLPQRYQRRDLEAWKRLGADAPAGERAAQAFALSELERRPADSADLLLRLLGDPDPSVRLAAIVAAGRLAPPVAAVAERLGALLASDREPLRRHAREALGRLGATALPVLRTALGDERVRVRWGALVALGRVGDVGEPLAKPVEALARQDANATVRRQARYALAQLGARGAEAACRFLHSADLAERSEAAAALAHAGPDALAPLVALLQDEDVVAAALAAGVLADHGPAAAPTVPALVRALGREGAVRFNAADALVAVGEAARAPVRALLARDDPALVDVARFVLDGLDAKARAGRPGR